MIATDENALICDLAETYHIYDYRSLPPSRVAAFSVGLRDNSRIKMKMNGLKVPFETLLLAAVVDRLSMLVWMKTEDARNGTNRPKFITTQLTGENEESTMAAFDTPEDFELAWKKMVEGSRK